MGGKGKHFLYDDSECTNWGYLLQEINYAYLCNIVSAQPSTAISWVAARKLSKKNEIVSIFKLGISLEPK